MYCISLLGDLNGGRMRPLHTRGNHMPYGSGNKKVASLSFSTSMR